MAVLGGDILGYIELENGRYKASALSTHYTITPVPVSIFSLIKWGIILHMGDYNEDKTEYY